LVFGIVAVIVISTVLSVVATGNGLAYESDGFYYLSMAHLISTYLGPGEGAGIGKNLLRQITKQVAETARRWPPGYPFLLSLMSFSSNSYAAGRRLHLLFPSAIGILIWLIFRQQRRSLIRAFSAISVILLCPAILVLNWYVFSEMLFLIWQLLTLLAVGRYLRARNLPSLFLAIACIAIASLTRYVGVAMAFALALLVWRINYHRSILQKMKISGGCVLMSILPLCIYLMIPVFADWHFDIAGRSFYYYWDWDKIFFFSVFSFLNACAFLSPTWSAHAIQVLFVSYAFIMTIIIIVRQRHLRRRFPPEDEALWLQRFILWSALTYVVLILVCAFFLDPVLGHGITSRIFAPFFVWLVLLTAINGPAISAGIYNYFSPTKWTPVIVFVLFLVSIYLVGGTLNAFEHSDMVARKHKMWDHSQALEYIKEKENGTWVVSNKACQTFLYSGIFTLQLPSHFDIVTYQPNKKFSEQMSRLREMLRREKGLVLFFNPYFDYISKGQILQDVTLEECMDLLDLQVVSLTENCIILSSKS
jgi:hypothetical protein